MKATKVMRVLAASVVLFGSVASADAPQWCDLEDPDLAACLSGCGLLQGSGCLAAYLVCLGISGDPVECGGLFALCDQGCEQDCISNECPYEGTPWYIDPGNSSEFHFGTPVYPFVSLTEALEDEYGVDPDELGIVFMQPSDYPEVGDEPMLLNQPLWLINPSPGAGEVYIH